MQCIDPVMLESARMLMSLLLLLLLQCIYTLNHKKRDILFLTITLANLNQFLYLLYHFNREEILHTTVVKLSHHLNCVRTLPGKIKTYMFAVIHKT